MSTFTIANVTVAFEAAAPDADLSQLEAGPLAPNDTAPITVIPRDASGFDLGPGANVELETTAGTLEGEVTDNGDGTYSQTLSLDGAESAEVSASVDGILLCATVTVTGVPELLFLRGDCDGNGRFGASPTEAIIGMDYSFRGAEPPPCLAACDAEADGSLGITDYLRILRAAFLGAGEPDPPFPECGTSDSETDLELGCETPPAACNE